MSTTTSPAVSPNYTKYNARNKTLVNVKCCVCLESYHPASVFFCRGCDSGIVCDECMKSMPKKSGKIFIGSDPVRANIIDRGIDSPKVIIEQCLMNVWTTINSVQYSSYTNGDNSTSSEECNAENVREICYLIYERHQKYGYGTKKSNRMPKCPCCRGHFTYLSKGYKIKHKLHIHRATAHTKLLKAISDSPIEVGANSVNKHQLEKLKIYCSNHIEDGQWTRYWNYNARSSEGNLLWIPNALIHNLPYPSSRALENVNAMMNANTLVVPGVEQDTRRLNNLFEEGQNLRVLMKEYEDKCYAMANKSFSSFPLIKLFSTQEGRDSVITVVPVKPYVLEYLMTQGGLYTHGLNVASGGGSKARAKVKALPTSVEDVMARFGSMTKEERALLAAELNAM